MELEKKLREFSYRYHVVEWGRQLVVPGIAILASIILALFFVGPSILGAIAAYQEIEMQKERLSAVTTKRAILEDTNAAQIQQQFERVITYLPSHKDLPLLFSTLASLELESGLLLQSIQVTPNEISSESASPSAVPEPLDLSISANGSLANLQTFLSNITASPVLMRMNDAQFTRNEQGGVVELYIRTYVFPHQSNVRAKTAEELELTTEEKKILTQLE